MPNTKSRDGVALNPIIVIGIIVIGVLIVVVALLISSEKTVSQLKTMAIPTVAPLCPNKSIDKQWTEGNGKGKDRMEKIAKNKAIDEAYRDLLNKISAGRSTACKGTIEDNALTCDKGCWEVGTVHGSIKQSSKSNCEASAIPEKINDRYTGFFIATATCPSDCTWRQGCRVPPIFPTSISTTLP